VLDLEAGSATCPSGQTTQDFKPNPAGGGQFRFAAVVCAACPLRTQCVRGGGGRTVAVHPQERLLQAARAFQASPAFSEYRRRRQMVEHRIARLVQLGIRQARDVGRAKTEFQLLMAAAVANLTYLAATAIQPTGPNSGTLVLLAGLLGLLAGVISRALDPRWPADAPNALGPSRTSSPGRQRTPLPTALVRPGSRPVF
jgi:Transposase DDE domain